MARKFRAVSCLVLLPVTSAFAQSTPKSEEAAGTLVEIIVTASRRAESSQEAALSVQPITAEELSRAGIKQPEDLNAIAPGVQMGTGGNMPQVYIRGVGNFATNAFAESAVAMNVDGVYISRGWAVRGTFFDLERVEVLKGPQGTLYGRNASGGALNLISARPTQESGGYVEVEGGNYNLMRGTGAVNVPISPEFAVRAAGQVVSRDGYLSDGYNDEESESARLHALWTPTEDLSLLLTGGYQHMGGQGPSGVLYPAVAGDPWRGPSDPATTAIYSSDPFTGQFLVAPDRTGYVDMTAYSMTAELNWNTDAGTLTLLPSYRDATLDSRNFVPGFFIENHERDKQTSFETRFSHENAWIKYVVGAYYFDEEDNQQDGEPQLLVLQGVGAQTVGPASSLIRSYAGFGQATVSVTPELRVTGGLRYTYERKETQFDSISYSLPNPPVPPPSQPCPGLGVFVPPNVSPPPQPLLFCQTPFSVDNEVSYNSWTYKAGVEYDLAPESLLYANVSTGFKSGGFFIGPEPNTFKAEELTAFDIGSKNRFLNNRMQFNVDAYYWVYDDHQESHVGPTSLQFFTFITENAGKATLYGIDLDVTLLVTDDDRFDVKLAYEKSEYDSFAYSWPTAGLGGVPPHTGCNVGPVVGGVQSVDCSGKQVVRAPEWIGTVAYERTFRMGGAGDLTAAAQVQFASSSYLSIDFLDQLKQPSYEVYDFDLNYRAPNGKWNVTGYVRNIGNQEVYTTGFLFPFTTPANPLRPDGVNWLTIRAPRTYGLQLRYDF